MVGGSEHAPSVAAAPAGAPPAPGRAAGADPGEPMAPELVALLPTPSQERGQATVRAIVEAAVGILDEVDTGAAVFTTGEVRRRAGVTTGSVYHHFGDATRLLAVARAVRFRRSLTAAVDAGIARYAAIADADEMARVTRAAIVARDLPTVRADVWTLTDALAAARDVPELAGVVSAVFRSELDRIERVFLDLRDRGALPADVHPRTVLLFSRTLSHARLLDDLDPDPVPHHDWVTVSCRLFDALLDPRPVDIGAPTESRRLADLRGAIRPISLEEDPDDRSGDGAAAGASVEADRRRMVARARDVLLMHGPAAVQVGRIRAEQGRSSGWFHRALGSRDELLDAARLDLLERSLAAEARSFTALVALARTPDELVDTVADWVTDPPRDPVAARMRSMRTDLLVAARQRAGLGHEAGLVIRRATEAMAEAVVEAQVKGLLRPDLAPRALARVAHAVVHTAMLIELDGRPPDAAAWRNILRRGLRPLTR
jgi:AcrR family transcriptional regulator